MGKYYEGEGIMVRIGTYEWRGTEVRKLVLQVI